MQAGTEEAVRPQMGRLPSKYRRHNADARPSSTVTDEPWLWAHSEVEPRLPSVRPGKWMLFVAAADADEVWTAVKEHTVAGRFGSTAKVATAFTQSDPKVICIYTYDYTDEADVYRVEQAIRAHLSWEENINYKTDAMTLAGVYSYRGGNNGPVSEYRSTALSGDTWRGRAIQRYDRAEGRWRPVTANTARQPDPPADEDEDEEDEEEV